MSSRRGNRGRAGWAALCAALACTLALPAWATKVVDVRMGRHVDFTRVVFELDTPAGYRIERSEPGPGISELVVSLDASARQESLTTKNALVENVTMEPRGAGGSIARIRLARDGLRLKEMILASPPRIVLDILSDEAGKAATATEPAEKTKPAATAKTKPATQDRATPKTKPATQDRTTAKTKPATQDRASAAPESDRAEAARKARREAEARAEAAREEARRAAEAAEARAREAVPAKPNGTEETDAATLEIPSEALEPAVDAAAPGGGVVPGESGSAESAARERARRDAAATALAEAMGAEMPDDEAVATAPGDAGPAEDAADEPQQLAMATPDSRAGALEPTPPARRPTPPAREAPATPPARRSQPADDGGFGLTGLIAVGAIVLLAAGFVWMRRRRANGHAEEAAAYEEDNPFAGLDSGDEVTLTEGSVPVAAESGGAQETKGGPGSFDVPGTAAETDQGDLFAEPSQGATMESASSEFETTLASNQPAPGVAGLGDDVTALIRELERRVSSLETRLDEVVDAKERLERQVVAQTEELRVQRAAIARTQRAVRNMSQSGDDSSATEPALRNPEAPA